MSLSPNPFSFGTSIRYVAGASGPVELIVRDVSGREVERLEFRTDKGSGQYYWQPNELVPGVYFLSLNGAGTESTARVLLLD